MDMLESMISIIFCLYAMQGAFGKTPFAPLTMVSGTAKFISGLKKELREEETTAPEKSETSDQEELDGVKVIRPS